jgi:hypothetical protein
MKNITVAVSDRTNRDARVWAARRDTSLSNMCRTFWNPLPNIRSACAFPLTASESDSENRNETGIAAGSPPAYANFSKKMPVRL